MKEITIDNIDIKLLRKQLKVMFLIRATIERNEAMVNSIDGIINLIEHIIDKEEGFSN